MRSSSPAGMDDNPFINSMARSLGRGARPPGSHLSSDGAALDHVDLGIGPSGTSGAYLSDSDDSDMDDPPVPRRRPNLVEAGVQTDIGVGISDDAAPATIEVQAEGPAPSAHADDQTMHDAEGEEDVEDADRTLVLNFDDEAGPSSFFKDMPSFTQDQHSNPLHQDEVERWMAEEEASVRRAVAEDDALHQGQAV